MAHGLLAGLLRLKTTTEQRSRVVNPIDDSALSDHERRDLGMLDGRVSPSTVERRARSAAWDLIDQPPHSL